MKKKLLIATATLLILLVFVSVRSISSDSSTSSEESSLDLGVIEIEQEASITSSLVVEPEDFDLGKVIYGEVAEKTFKLKNSGDKPLNILKISTSCGCTNATVLEEDKLIQSGEEVDMVVTFDPAVHGDDSDVGDIVRVVYIRTDDEFQPETEVTIEARVIKN